MALSERTFLDVIMIDRHPNTWGTHSQKLAIKEGEPNIPWYLMGDLATP